LAVHKRGAVTEAGMDTLDLALFILQVAVGLTFAAHGAQKLFGWWDGPGMTGWEGAMDRMGFRPPRVFAWISALVEFVGGLMLAVGVLTPLVAAVIVAQAVVIIGRAHWTNGFFNQRSGIEYPLLLGAGAAAIGLGGPSALSVDAASGFVVDPTLRVLLVVAGIAAGLIVLTIPRLGTRTRTTNA
jgi:putative oxidoreductase